MRCGNTRGFKSLSVHFFIIIINNWLIIEHHSSDEIKSLVSSSSYVFIFIFNKHPNFVSNASISTIRTDFDPKNRPAKFTATIFPLATPSIFSIFFSPKCLISYCSAACVEAYFNWKVLFSSNPFIFSHCLEN